MCLGLVSHNSVIKTLGGKLSAHKFGHNAAHDLNGMTVIDSYHCSRYNQNTGRLTAEMFDAVFARAVEVAAALG